MAHSMERLLKTCVKSYLSISSKRLGLFDVPRRCVSWKRVKQREIKKDITFKYAGAKRGDRLYVWGYAATGALGVRKYFEPNKFNEEPRSREFNPYGLNFWDDLDHRVHDAACGYGFTVFLCKGGSKHTAYGTGINTDSQLGYQAKAGHVVDYVVIPSRIELPLMYPDTTHLLHAACGRAHTFILTDKEGIFSLGNNAYGQCGRTVVENEKYRGSQIINKVAIDETVIHMECGEDHTLFLTEAGTVYSCGLGSDGQTGIGHYRIVERPTPVAGDIVGEKIVSISSRGDCVLAVSENGDVFGWGNSEYSQLSSVTEETQVSVARHLPFSGIGRVVKVAAAGSMCALLNDEGHVYVWGYGILGKGPKVDQSEWPTQIPPTLFQQYDFNPDVKVIDIKCGLNHFAALTNEGVLYHWGKNTEGVLGLGHVKDQFFPFQVPVPAEVRKIIPGVDHTVALCKAFA